jgi:hypothetical protein
MSADRPLVVDVLERRGTIHPDLPLCVAEQRWSTYVEDPVDAQPPSRQHAATHRLQQPERAVRRSQARFVNWAWATRGAAWLDPALYNGSICGQAAIPARCARVLRDSRAYEQAAEPEFVVTRRRTAPVTLVTATSSGYAVPGLPTTSSPCTDTGLVSGTRRPENRYFPSAATAYSPR